MSTTDLQVQERIGAETTAAEITEHVEPRAQGGERYVRCTGCGRELLVAYGGRDKLPHLDDCPNAN